MHLDIMQIETALDFATDWACEYGVTDHECVRHARLALERLVTKLKELEEYKAYRQQEDAILQKERDEQRAWDEAMDRLREIFS